MSKNKVKNSQTMKSYVLGEKPLSCDDVVQISKGFVHVSLSKKAISRIQTAENYLKQISDSDQVVYGVNTGFGILSNVRIPKKDLIQLQINLLRSHAVGTGDAIPDEWVRAMILLRAANLTQGHSGVKVETVQALLDLLNANVIPYIPEQGSVGASGDLSPLAHLSLVLIGEGKAKIRGEKRKNDFVSGGEILKRVGLKPVTLGPKEGLALINGTQFMAALSVFALHESERLLRLATLTGAMSLEAMRGTIAAFDEKIHAVRPHPGQMDVARDLRKILSYPKTSQIAKSHVNCTKVQDPYSLRCIPQVHGASLDTFRFCKEIVEREINSVTDNPLVFPKEKQILSGGNFHGQYLALAMDYLAIAMAEIGSISEQRIEKLVNPVISELPAFLMKKAGINSGFMIVQVAAASIVSENKTLSHPASVDTIPTSADKEDHVSMGAWASRKCMKVVENVRRVLVMELMAASQGIDLLRPLTSTVTLEKLHAEVREKVPFFEEDAPFYESIDALLAWTHETQML